MTEKTKVVHFRVKKDLKNELIKICENQGLVLSKEFSEWAENSIDLKSVEKDPELRRFKQEYGKINTTISGKKDKIKSLQFDIKCLEAQSISYSELIEKRIKEVDKNDNKKKD